MGFIGILGSCIYSIPFVIIHSLVKKEYIGIGMSLLVSSIQIGISVVGWLFYFVLIIYDDIVIVMIIGSVLSVFATIISLFIIPYINPISHLDRI